MSPPLGHVEEVPGRVLCSKSLESNSHNLKEHDYIGLSEVSSMGSSGSGISCSTDEEKGNSLNLKETELRLGLPGSDSPDRKSELCLLGPLKTEDKTPFPLMNLVSGAKRGFSDAMDASRKGASADGKWRFSAAAGSEIDLPKGAAQGGFLSSSVSPGSGIVKQGSGNWHCNGALDHLPSGFLSPRAKPSTAKDNTPQLVPASAVKEISSTKLSQEKPRETTHSQISPANDPGIAPAAKAQVVGWPPIRSFRRTTMSTNPTKNSEEAEGKQGLGCLYVKVSMDGAPYLRKVDLKTYSNYLELSSALEKMFSCFTIGHCGSHGGPGRDGLNESRLMDFLHGSEYVPTYEDKDGDWMLVGDVPWEMFTNSCRRLRIMKGSEAIGLGMLLIYRECLYAVPHGGTVHTVRYWLNCASEEYKRDTCPINGRYQTVNCSFMQDCVTRFSLNLGHACACHGLRGLWRSARTAPSDAATG